MSNKTDTQNNWIEKRIKRDQISKYMEGGLDFINDQDLENKISSNKNPDRKYIEEILEKSLSIKTLNLNETAALLNVSDPDLLKEMASVALKIKKKVYDNRIVTFAPLYLNNQCVNDCLYCGFRKDNKDVPRRILNMDEIKAETETLAGKIGHKRLIVVYGEDEQSGIDYMVESIKNIYGVKVKTRNGFGQIRRVNVNAPALSIEELKQLKDVGIGTYQVFQETYHHPTYGVVHPKNTIKGDYDWRLYSMHRAFEAGIDDVGIGVLFGLYDWRFEVMGLIAHSIELERRFGVGPHTISFPRLESASNAPYTQNSKYKVSDEDFKKLITVIRLSVPHTGMIITARETHQMRRDALSLGYTQTDASTRIGIGAYSDRYTDQEVSKQQFTLGDTRTLDELVREFAEMGYITSFCTAGYRCGRTGECIMGLLRDGEEGKFCKLNAVITFREWLDDFATADTKIAGEKIIKKELKEIEELMPKLFPKLMAAYEKTSKGQRDIYF